MEVLSAAAAYLRAAKASIIRAGIELNKIPTPMQHGCKLLRMVNDLDRIQAWAESDEGKSSEGQAVRAKPKKRSRLQKKIDQSHVPAETPGTTAQVPTPPALRNFAG